MQRRNLLGMTTAAGAVAAVAITAATITAGDPAATVASTINAASGERTDCTAAGVGHAGANAVTFDGATVMVAAELQVGDKPTTMTGALAASPDGTVVVRVTDDKGPDRIEVSTDSGAAWSAVTTGRDIAYPAVSPSGERIVFSVAGALTLADRSTGWKPAPVALPGQGARHAQYLRFVDEQRVLMSVQVAVPGVADRFAALSDVWLHDLASGAWQRLTTTTPDPDRWSIAKTPVLDRDGSLLYVRHTGLGSGTDADLRTELHRVAPDGTDKPVGELADRQGIVAVDGTGAILWNVPDERSQWQLLQTAAGGAVSGLGCGRSSWAPSLNHDPDYTP